MAHHVCRGLFPSLICHFHSLRRNIGFTHRTSPQKDLFTCGLFFVLLCILLFWWLFESLSFPKILDTHRVEAKRQISQTCFLRSRAPRSTSKLFRASVVPSRSRAGSSSFPLRSSKTFGEVRPMGYRSSSSSSGWPATSSTSLAPSSKASSPP